MVTNTLSMCGEGLASTHFVRCSTAIARNFKFCGAVGRGTKILIPRWLNGHVLPLLIVSLLGTFVTMEFSWHLCGLDSDLPSLFLIFGSKPLNRTSTNLWTSITFSKYCLIISCLASKIPFIWLAISWEVYVYSLPSGLISISPAPEPLDLDALWKSYCKGDVGYYEIHRADGSYKTYIFFSEMLNDFDREDLIVLYRLLNENDDEVWKNHQHQELIEWKLYDSCGVHSLMLGEVSIHMLVEKKYPLPQDTLTRMLQWKLHVNNDVTEMAYELLSFLVIFIVYSFYCITIYYYIDILLSLQDLVGINNAGCKDYCKSTSSGIQFLGDKLVSWSSKKQDCIAMSIAEAEYVSLSACCAQVTWMRTQLLDYGYKYNRIPKYCDSKSAIAISCNAIQHSHTKHIDIRYHLIKEHVEKGTVELFFVSPEYQLAGLFTKALPKERF
ncbi:hypothetical protein Tco_1243434 [Tanacetum coccineum]